MPALWSAPGRTFLQRMLDLLKSSHHRKTSTKSFIRLNCEARSDILWWHCFISHWNGLSMMQDDKKACPDMVLTSDAYGAWGCGAFWLSSWFQFQWSDSTREYHITVKELLPIVFATAVWGQHWENKSVLCWCDNEAVVHNKYWH